MAKQLDKQFTGGGSPVCIICDNLFPFKEDYLAGIIQADKGDILK